MVIPIFKSAYTRVQKLCNASEEEQRVNDKKIQTEAEKMGIWNEVAGWKSTGVLLAVEGEALLEHQHPAKKNNALKQNL